MGPASLSLSSLMDFPSFSKSQRPHFSISLRRKTAFSEFQASPTVVCFCEILAALRAKQWIRRESWQDSPSSHLTIESSHGFPDQGDAVSLRTVGVCATTCVTAVQFAVWGLPVGWARKGKEREKKKSETSLTLSLGSHLPPQKDIRVTLWGDSHGGELRSLATGNEISCQHLWGWTWEQVLQHQADAASFNDELHSATHCNAVGDVSQPLSYMASK